MKEQNLSGNQQRLEEKLRRNVSDVDSKIQECNRLRRDVIKLNRSLYCSSSQLSLTLENLDKAEAEIERLNNELKKRNDGFFKLTCYALVLNAVGAALVSFLIWIK